MLSRRTALAFGAMAALALAPRPAAALSVSLTSVADTGISENYPNNNMGGNPFVNSGTTQNRTRNRGLFRFDVAAALPAGAKVQSATLVLEVVHEPDEQQPFSRFNLHRLLQPWGEGNKTSPTNCNSCVGQGAPAGTNETTWFHRFAYTASEWSAPGAAPTNDYAAQPSSGTTVYGVADSPYPFASTPQTVADVQFWLDEPQSNFGWALVCQAEQTPFTARRFGSRESPDRFPRLEIEFLVQPRIDRAEKVGGQFNLSFMALAGQSYVVEYCDSLSGGVWQTLAHVGMPAETTRVLVIDPVLAPQRFYRVASY